MSDPTLDATEVFLPVDGALYSAVYGTALPTTADAALNGAFVGHGYWSNDGVTESTSQSRSPLRAFQNNALVANPVTEGTATIKLVLWQKNAENVELYFGNAVDGTDGSVDWTPGTANGVRSFVLDKIVGTSVERTVIPRGEVTEMGDRVTVAGKTPGYPITITCYDDSMYVCDTDLVES